jgi:hypothetical protein
MRGFPMLNLFIALLLSGGVVFPLVWRQTHSSTPAAAARAPEPKGVELKVPAHVSLRFVHPPAKVKLTGGGAMLHEWNAPSGLLLEESVLLPLSDNRVAAGLEIEWPAGTPAANNVVVSIEPQGAQSWKDTFFSDAGAVDEIIEFDLRP